MNGVHEQSEADWHCDAQFHDTYGKLVPATTERNRDAFWGWCVYIMPQLELANTYDRLNITQGSN
ncbi:hypothetical protein Pan97_28860 [Bremerella volcania]|uniref:Uncharacterized protein n=1 Tax=Bremerella volcania TaxID=2527984 RepID=A0A518C9H3_9BACT|nr:hypothetical protein Pan97_28860 [Bremerella volcania]